MLWAVKVRGAMSPTLSLLSLLLILSGSVTLPKFVVPKFSDLTIKTRLTMGGGHSTIQTVYLKGPRQRSEDLADITGTDSSPSISISQCDQKLRLILNQKEKTYVSFPIEDWSERIKKAHPIPQEEMSGAEVTVTIDSVDTGERRQLGSYQARRVKTTTKVEPGPGAVTPASVTEVDGWYVDLPGLYCQGSKSVGTVWSDFSSGKRDRVVFKRLGTTPRGYPIEETTRITQPGRTTVSKTELLELSEAPLDNSLFELPATYAPALRLPGGGNDMTKPDTFGNRVRVYWAALTQSVQRWLR